MILRNFHMNLLSDVHDAMMHLLWLILDSYLKVQLVDHSARKAYTQI